jgi:hypothetical protein
MATSGGENLQYIKWMKQMERENGRRNVECGNRVRGRHTFFSSQQIEEGRE